MLYEIFMEALKWGIPAGLSALALWWRKQQKARNAAIAARDKQFAEIAAAVMEIQKQVRPNGGGSLADSITRKEVMLRELMHDVALIRDTQHAIMDANPMIGYFECDALGRIIRVSETYAGWLNVGTDDLLGWELINFIPEDEADDVRRKWEQCRHERREYKNRHHLIPRGGGKAILVDVTASPIPPGQEPSRWVGFVVRVE